MNGNSQRDLRIDFLRGLALIFIFVDHIPNNGLDKFTLRNVGFSDAAEAFVLLAGMSAILAYSPRFERDGFRAGAASVINRVLQIYYWQLGVILTSFALLYWAAATFADAGYINNIGFQKFLKEPIIALSRAAILEYQPNMLNILPLYVVLMLWFPVVYWIMQRSEALAVGISVAIWGAANIFRFNLPSAITFDHGWFLNPFAWQLLLTMGALAGRRLKQGDFPKVNMVVAACIVFLIVAFAIRAPWTSIPGLQNLRFVSGDLANQMDKTYLSIWRLTHILALAYVIFCIVPAQANWLKSNWANFIVRCGQNALEIFSLGIILSFAGWIVLQEAGPNFAVLLLVNFAGIFLMGLAARFLSQYKRAPRNNILSVFRRRRLQQTVPD